MCNIDEAYRELTPIIKIVEESGIDYYIDIMDSLFTWFDEENTRDYFYSHGVRFDYGCTRVAFWAESNPHYVYKIQITDGFSSGEEEEDIGNWNCDYGAMEYRVYEEARLRELEQCFAWVEKMDNFMGRPAYAMEYCEHDEDYFDELLDNYGFMRFCSEEGIDPEEDDSRDRYWNSGSYARDDQDGMLELASYECWGNAVANSVDWLLQDYEINDVHQGNWGIRTNPDGVAFLVMFDYGGYRNV